MRPFDFSFSTHVIRRFIGLKNTKTRTNHLFADTVSFHFKLHPSAQSIRMKVCKYFRDWLESRWDSNVLLCLSDPLIEPHVDLLMATGYAELINMFGKMPYICRMNPTSTSMARHLLRYVVDDPTALEEVRGAVWFVKVFSHEEDSKDIYLKDVAGHESPILTPQHPNWPEFCRKYKEYENARNSTPGV